MELDELKSLWKADYDQLQNSLSLNRALISKADISTSMGEYKKLRQVSIFGRNMALVYAAISIVWAITIFFNFIYSIPLLLGGAAMIWSFTQHLAIESAPNYHAHSIIELQRKIQRFRIHTAKHKIYDGLIVLFWLLTIAPIYLQTGHHYDIYASASNIFTFAMVAIVLFGITGFLVNKMYGHIDGKLKDAEEALEEIDMFEGFTG